MGFLERLPKAFSLLAFAISVVLASRLARMVVYHGVKVQSLKGLFVVFSGRLRGICLAPLLTLIIPLATSNL